jgi:lipopolysaccharide heptosyltransferase II
MKRDAPEFDPKKILIILHGSIGDVTRALPLANLLRKGFPRSFVAWSIEPSALPLLQGNDTIDDVIVFERQRGWRAFGPFLARIRAIKFDLVLDLQRHLKSGLISWCTGARQRIGFNRADAKELNWLFNNLHIGQFGEEIPKLDHYLKFAQYLGIPQQPLEWNFALTAGERAAVDRHLAAVNWPFAVLFAGARWESKRWFPAQIARCAEILRNEHHLDVALLGGKEDRLLAQEVIASASVPITDLVGCTVLREAIGIIERAKLAVGPDTGLMHIAAAVRTPVVSLWGATNPQRTGPYGFDELVIRGKAPCVPCNRRNCRIGRVCMKSIADGEIADKIRLAISRETAAQGRHAEGR